MSVKAKPHVSLHIKTKWYKPAGNFDKHQHLPACNSGCIPACSSGRGNASAQYKLELNPHAKEKDADVIEILSAAVVQCVNTVTGEQFSTPVFQILNNVNGVG